MLTLKRLRQRAYAAWEVLCGIKGVYLGAPESMDMSQEDAARLPWTNEVFKAEIRKTYGDLRCRVTWESAAIQLMAHMMVQSYMEPYQIVGYMASPAYMQCEIREQYGDRLIEAMLQFPEILDIVREGLEQLVKDPGDPEDQTLATAFLTHVTPRLSGGS